MTWLINVFIFCGALLAVAHGASLATADDKGDCSFADGFEALSCLFRMQDFVEKIDQLDMENKDEVKEFKRSCDSLEKCVTGIGKCKKNAEKDKESAEISAMIKSYCDAVVYVSNDFAACATKLEKKESKCFDDWDPFPDGVEEEKDEKKKEEKKKEACKNFFGKDNCLEKEIKENCSEKEWLGFKNHFLSLNTIMKQCDI